MPDAPTRRSDAGPDPLTGLRSLIAEVVATNVFYGRKFAAASCSAGPGSITDFTARFPFTTKAELVADQTEHPPYGTGLTYPLARYTRCHQTSGTSGAPLRWLDTPESWEAMKDDWCEVFHAAGVTAADPVFFAFSFGPFLGFWLAFEAAQKIGCLCFPGGGMGTALRARVLLENGCTVLCCTPTYALHLAATARAEGLDIGRGRIRRIIVAGEPGGSLPATRARLEEAWPGAEVFDHHGMTEVGPVTYEVPGRPGTLAVMTRSFFAEVVDPATGAPVGEGATGELVLTTLRRSASPLIRYRTGDLVRATLSPASDLRPPTLWLEGGILGRVDDMVVVRGVNIYPSAVEQIVRGLDGIGEYRVTLDTRGAMAELAIEAETTPMIADELARRLHQALALRVPVGAVADGSLPRSELKARRWIRR